MNKNKVVFTWFYCLILGLIIAFSFWIKTIRLDQRYGFDWDQADDATKVMTMVWEKKPVLIGPRVASENGFFVGPYHYYFLAPFYLITGGNPIAGAYAVMAVSAITILIAYYVGASMYSPQVGLVAALVISSSPSLTSWNAMFIAPIALLGYYLCTKLLSSNKLFLSTVALASLGAGLHLVPASLLAYLLVAQIISSNRATSKQIFIGILIVVLFALPLIIFDLRHDFLNSHKFMEFVFNKGTQISVDKTLFAKTLWKSLFITNSLPFKNGLIFEKILVLLSFGYAFLKMKNSKIIVFSLLWISLPVILMSQYHGNISEYYYGFITSLIPLFLAHFLVSLLPVWLTGIFMYFLIQGQVSLAKVETTFIPLKDKLNVVRYIATQKDYPVFNVSYNLPLGYNTGYQYLFKYLKNEPVSGPEGHLYSIALRFDQNEKFIFTSGLLGVIRR